MTLKLDKKQTNKQHSPIVTADELWKMADVGRAELIDGEVVSYTPHGHLHGYLEGFIGTLVMQFVRLHDLGRAYSGGVGIYIRRQPDTIRSADVAFVSHERLAKLQSNSYLDVAPELVVEVMSPTDRWGMVIDKLEDYFSIGVQMVWLVEPNHERVHVYRSLTEIEIFNKDEVLNGGEVLVGFELPLDQLFTE